MSDSETRREKLRAHIAARYGSIRAFANRHNLDESHISQILGSHRSFGEKAARNMELKCGYPKYFFDTPADENEFEAVERSLDQIDWLQPQSRASLLELLKSMKPSS